MDNNGEPYDLVTVLSRLEDLKGVAQDIGRHSNDDQHVTPSADAERTGLFRKILRSLRSRQSWADGSALPKS